MKGLRVGKFAIVGALLALANFLIYTFLARVIMNSNELLWLDSMISYALSTILAYFAHSRITWRERRPGKLGVLKFFLWNFLTALLISPFFTWIFSFFTPVYGWGFGILSNWGWGLDYNFVESTGVFCLTTAVTMVLNYIFYDKLVFGDETKYIYSLKNVKVSLIAPVYNVENYVEKCVETLIKQTHQNLEIILVDDGSTDESLKILQRLARKDKRIRVVHQENAGQSAARNAGLKLATGDFVGFIDSDDYVTKDFVEKLLAPYSEDDTGLSVCGIHYKRILQKTAQDVYTEPLRRQYKRESLKTYILYLLAIDGRMYSSVNKLYRTKIAQKCHFKEKLRFAEDTEFVLEYLAKMKGAVRFVSEPLYIYNYGTETSTIRETGVKWENWERTYQDLRTWAGPQLTLRKRFWLMMVRCRWRISHRRAVKRAKKCDVVGLRLG